jgi:hypothetical protein
VQVQRGTGTWSYVPDQFAHAPDVSARILASVERELSEITAELEVARGPDMVAREGQAVGRHSPRDRSRLLPVDPSGCAAALNDQRQRGSPQRQGLTDL